MKIQCLIDRDGVTSVNYAGFRYDFVRNKKGHYVCEVNNPGAVAFFNGFMGGTWYREYIEEPELKLEEKVEPEVLEDETGGDEDLKSKYETFTKKADIQEACLEDFGVELDPRLSLDRMKKKVFSLI
jgi:hypothetical protein